MPSLITHGVTYGYGRDARSPSPFAIRDVTLAIRPGSLTALLGPNGCGKTTLLKLLAGILSPQSGVVELDGIPLKTMTRKAVARRIAVVPQETHPAFEYSVMDMVLMGRHPHLATFTLEGPTDMAIAAEALRATGTIHLAHRLYSTLSGGEKQRVVIASALAQQPQVLLLDEPTASLDLGYQLEVASMLRDLNHQRDVTMVVATHDLNLAAALCDTVVMMREGRVLAEGATRDVLSRENVARLYDVEADVSFHDRAGHLTIVPVRRR